MQLSGAPQGAPFFLPINGTALDDQESDNHEPGDNAGSGYQHLAPVPPGPIDAGGTARSNQGRVKFGRVRIGARQCGASTLGIDLKRNRVGVDLWTSHARIVPRIG